jgi:hypothetical protein
VAIHADKHERLAVDQAALVAALTARGEPPPGFDAARLQAAADSLAKKRARAAARAWPGLAESFGPSYQAIFLEFAAQVTLPRDGGPLADARAFVRYRESRNDVPDDVRRRALAVDLRFKTTGRGLVARRLPACRMAWFRTARRLVVGIWIPACGERWFSLSLGWSHVPESIKP